MEIIGLLPQVFLPVTSLSRYIFHMSDHIGLCLFAGFWKTITISGIRKGKGFYYSLPSVWPGADPGVQAVSPQVTISHPPSGRLPLHSARFAVTFPAAEHRRPLVSIELYCLVTEAHRCELLAQGCYVAFASSRI